jgi:hypothetical protein
MRPLIHIDGDILVYAGGFAAERGQYKLTWLRGDVEESKYFQKKKEVDAYIKDLGCPYMLEFERTPEPVEYALANVKNIIGAICDELAVDDYIVYLSGPTNFRTALATIREYKGNRDKAHKPVHGPAIREYLNRQHPCVVSDNEEADDVIGYSHYARWQKDPESSIIATQDKDLNMIPGWHYNFAKQGRVYIEPGMADYFFYKQLLTGDATDNIQGVPGIGPRKAERLLEGCEDALSMYEVVQAVYDNDEALLENARLLWIRREPGQMWEPPNAVH